MRTPRLPRTIALGSAIFTGLVLLGCVPAIQRALVHNVSYLAITRQAAGREWSAWGLGLRAVVVPELRVGTPPRSGSSHWLTSTNLGVPPFLGERGLSHLGDCQSQRLIAARQMQASQWDAARTTLRSVVAACPSYPFAHLELALVLDRLNEAAAAAAEYEKGGIAEFARYMAAGNYLTLAGDCGRTGSPEASLCRSWLGRVLELAPGHPFALLRLTGTPASHDKSLSPETDEIQIWEDPRLNHFLVQAFVEAFEQEPAARIGSMLVTARQFGIRRDYENALLLYQAIESSDPRSAKLAYFAGLAAIASGKLELASGSFEEALAVSPEDVKILIAYARCEWRRGALARATLLYRRVLEVDPCSAEAGAFLRHTGAALPSATEACLPPPNYLYLPGNIATSGRIVLDPESERGQAVRGSRGFVAYGPYQALPPGTYQATFRLKAEEAISPGCLEVSIDDITDQSSGTWLVDLPRRALAGADLPPGRYRDVQLQFASPGGGMFEYRVFEKCGSQIDIESIKLEAVVQ